MKLKEKNFKIIIVIKINHGLKVYKVSRLGEKANPIESDTLLLNQGLQYRESIVPGGSKRCGIYGQRSLFKAFMQSSELGSLSGGF